LGLQGALQGQEVRPINIYIDNELAIQKLLKGSGVDSLGIL